MISKSIIDIANSFIGMSEIEGNMGWHDPKFQQLMESTGWNKGQSWCAYFTELVWKQAYKGNQEIFNKLDILFNAGAVTTFNNFLNDKTFQVNKICEPGCIVIWQYWHDGSVTWKGHAGIVIDRQNNEFNSIEGNTNANGGREGIEVAQRKRLLNFDVKNGLVLKGFIHPI
jgi:hypothetical protein